MLEGMAPPAKSRVLVVEDDSKTSALIRLYLEHAGYDIVAAADGAEALRLAKTDPRPDLVVLDVMLPKVNGLQICRELRLTSDVAIILLTARSTEEDRLEGLDLGADDYVSKPFSPRELVARVRAVLRRRPEPGSGARRASGVGRGNGAGRRSDSADEKAVAACGIEIDHSRREARVRGRAVELTPREFDLLLALVRKPGRAFAREDLAMAAFGSDYEALGRTIDAHVKNLRAKIERDPANPSLILTVFGIGYRLAEGPRDA